MPAGCVLAVHHFVEGAVSLKSGKHIKPLDADMCSLRRGELRERYASLDVLLDEEPAPSCDGGRPMCSFAARQPPLLRLCWDDGRRQPQPQQEQQRQPQQAACASLETAAVTATIRAVSAVR